VTVERERLLAEEKLMLIVTEASEAMEEIRDGHEFTSVYYEVHGVPTTKPLGFPIELADIVIRVFDLARACDVDLGAAVRRKMEFNRTRPHRHGGKLS
jgi:NTP pyrophosphatase (non-canonical NTP hydrolase)